MLIESATGVSAGFAMDARSVGARKASSEVAPTSSLTSSGRFGVSVVLRPRCLKLCKLCVREQPRSLPIERREQVYEVRQAHGRWAQDGGAHLAVGEPHRQTAGDLIYCCLLVLARDTRDLWAYPVGQHPWERGRFTYCRPHQGGSGGEQIPVHRRDEMGRREGDELASVFRAETARLLHALDDRRLAVLLDDIPGEEPVDRGVRGTAERHSRVRSPNAGARRARCCREWLGP